MLSPSLHLATLLISAFSLLHVDLCNAAPYRCGAKVQTYPCDFELHQVKRKVYVPPRGAARRNPHAQFAIPQEGMLTRQSFTRVNSRDGLWRGYLVGDGLYRLELHILNPSGAPSARHRIGDLKVAANEGPVRYSFKSTLPEGASWSWRVVIKRL